MFNIRSTRSRIKNWSQLRPIQRQNCNNKKITVTSIELNETRAQQMAIRTQRLFKSEFYLMRKRVTEMKTWVRTMKPLRHFTSKLNLQPGYRQNPSGITHVYGVLYISENLLAYLTRHVRVAWPCRFYIFTHMLSPNINGAIPSRRLH